MHFSFQYLSIICLVNGFESFITYYSESFLVSLLKYPSTTTSSVVTGNLTSSMLKTGCGYFLLFSSLIFPSHILVPFYWTSTAFIVPSIIVTKSSCTPRFHSLSLLYVEDFCQESPPHTILMVSPTSCKSSSRFAQFRYMSQLLVFETPDQVLNKHSFLSC